MTRDKQLQILMLWDTQRYDTSQIARMSGLPEWQVANLLARRNGWRTEPHPLSAQAISGRTRTAGATRYAMRDQEIPFRPV